LFFNEEEQIIEPYIDILDINYIGCNVITIQIASKNRLEVLNSSVSIDLIYTFIREKIKSSTKAIVGSLMANRIIAILLNDEEKNEYNRRVEIIKFSQDIIDSLSRVTNENINIGIGNYYNNIIHAKSSYRESLISLKYAKDSEVVHIMDILEQNDSKIYAFEAVEKIIEKIQFGKISEVILLFNDIFEGFVEEHYTNFENIKLKILEFMVVINRLALDNNIYDELNHNYISQILEIKELSTLKMYCMEKINYITGKIKIIKEKRFSNIIYKSIEYIDNNYKNDINLYDVAKYTSLSPHYFSKLFKDETKENFIDYLTRVRMDEAKYLLKNSNLTIKEICYNIGYKDPNYFSRIFKKHVGISASDFKGDGT
jgi:two-component system response regulator YesN